MKGNIYIDGSCIKNPGDGGWAVIFCDENDNIMAEMFGCEINKTTNNRMEMMAAIKAISSLKENSIVTINSDSEYVVKGITEYCLKWKKKNLLVENSKIKNVDLWIRLYNLTYMNKDKNIEINWKWVKGHSNNDLNNRCDFLAQNSARQKIKEKVNRYN